MNRPSNQDEPTRQNFPQPQAAPHRPQGTPRPRLAITAGDVAGVGPELALRCAALPEVYEHCTPVVVGPEAVLRRIASRLGLTCPPPIRLDQLADAAEPAILDVGDLAAGEVRPGAFDTQTGRASFEAVRLAIEWAIQGQVDGIVTGPIQKEAWHAAGVPYPGHTELLAAQTSTPDVRMMLTSETISCVLVTIHIPLIDVADHLSEQAIVRSIGLGAEALARRLGRPARVTVCGLNPHAGEHGMFSHGEESQIIRPAVLAALREGYRVIGPVPPDTAFTPAMRSQTDVYVCMYHDQGLIPLKALSFDEGVNVTLGLPIVRTSVDHGTALDLAWQGKASDKSMLAAIQMAVDLVL